MDNARQYWLDYVERKGGAKAVADLTGIPYSTIAGVCNGHRGIGRRLAIRLTSADPELDAGMLVLVSPGTEAIARSDLRPDIWPEKESGKEAA